MKPTKPPASSTNPAQDPLPRIPFRRSYYIMLPAAAAALNLPIDLILQYHLQRHGPSTYSPTRLYLSDDDLLDLINWLTTPEGTRHASR